MTQKGEGKVKSRALCSQSWVGGAQLPNFLLCLEGDKEERTDGALMQPPSGRSARAAGALEILWVIAAVLPALEGGGERRCSFSARPGSTLRPELAHIKRVWRAGFEELFLLSGRHTKLCLQSQRTDLCLCTFLQVPCEDTFSPLLEVSLFSWISTSAWKNVGLKQSKLIFFKKERNSGLR